MNDFESAKVNRAIQRGLARCRRSECPVVALAQFLDELRADPGWEEPSVRTVESAVRRILAKIVYTESYDEAGE